MKLFLDLDRTLFDTTRASLAVWQELSVLYDIDATTENTRQTEFYEYMADETYYYNFEAHLVACDIIPDTALQQLSASRIADNRLLMPGAVELIRQLQRAGWSPEILTFGQSYYQKLKIALCPILRDMPVHVTLSPKGEFLAGKGKCVLVDDKNIAAELPANAKLLWVQLEGGATDGALTSLRDVAHEIGSIR